MCHPPHALGVGSVSGRGPCGGNGLLPRSFACKVPSEGAVASQCVPLHFTHCLMHLVAAGGPWKKAPKSTGLARWGLS